MEGRLALAKARKAPSPFIIPELGFPVKCNPLSEIHSLMGIQALQRTNHK